MSPSVVAPVFVTRTPVDIWGWGSAIWPDERKEKDQAWFIDELVQYVNASQKWTVSHCNHTQGKTVESTSSQPQSCEQ